MSKSGISAANRRARRLFWAITGDLLFSGDSVSTAPPNRDDDTPPFNFTKKGVRRGDLRLLLSEHDRRIGGCQIAMQIDAHCVGKQTLNRPPPNPSRVSGDGS